MPTQPTFVVNTPVRDLKVYRQLATMVSKLKRHGRVEMNISALANKGKHEIPDGGSPWHEYSACNPAPAKFFPDPMIAPFLPESFVLGNRRLLMAKAEILREMGLGAAFWSYEPNFLPEAFFKEFPALRGPRTDHPRRSRHEEFAPCVDQPEVREMTTRMVAELATNVPELGTYFFKTNDAGPGLCWAHLQYSGTNGPSTCRSRSVGERVRGLIESIQAGGERAGRNLTVHMTGNFTAEEINSIKGDLPKDAFLREAGGGSLNIGTCADLCYPARGILDPVGTLKSLQQLNGRQVQTVFIDLRCFYDRGYERLDTTEKLIDIIDDFLADPVHGTVELFERARNTCRDWIGTDRGDELFETFVELNEAIKYKQCALPKLSTMYGAVSLRYINRPLVAVPERLSDEEQAYFLPHVFNVSHERGKLDYIDVHGTRHVPEWMSMDTQDPRVWAISLVRRRLNAAAEKLESFGDLPSGNMWVRMAAAVRLYANLLRSCGNFFAVQIIRDRNAIRVIDGPRLPPARAADRGHPDLQLLNEIMRDELDNAAEMVALLRRHGLDIITHADSADDEDTFLLGPDIVSQIERKAAIMRDHWLDAEDFFSTPNK